MQSLFSHVNISYREGLAAEFAELSCFEEETHGKAATAAHGHRNSHSAERHAQVDEGKAKSSKACPVREFNPRTLWLL